MCHKTGLTFTTKIEIKTNFLFSRGFVFSKIKKKCDFLMLWFRSVDSYGLWKTMKKKTRFRAKRISRFLNACIGCQMLFSSLDNKLWFAIPFSLRLKGYWMHSAFSELKWNAMHQFQPLLLMKNAECRTNRPIERRTYCT